MLRSKRARTSERMARLQEAETFIVIDADMTHAHGPYSSLKSALTLAQQETAKSGVTHVPVAFDFTTGIVIKPEEIEAALKQRQTETDAAVTRGYL